MEKNVPKFIKDIEGKAHYLTSFNKDIHSNLQKTLEVKEHIQATAKLLMINIEEQTCKLLQQCTEECEEPLRQAFKVTEESMGILDHIKEACTSKTYDDPIPMISKIAEWNKQVAKQRSFHLKTPNFGGNQNVNLGDLNYNTSLVNAMSNIKIGIVQRFQKHLEIAINDDVPLHISALEDGGVIYAGNKPCKYLDRFGNVRMTYEGIHCLKILCLSTKDDELFVFGDIGGASFAKYKISSGVPMKELCRPDWFANDVVILSSDNYLNLRKTQFINNESVCHFMVVQLFKLSTKYKGMID